MHRADAAKLGSVPRPCRQTETSFDISIQNTDYGLSRRRRQGYRARFDRMAACPKRRPELEFEPDTPRIAQPFVTSRRHLLVQKAEGELFARPCVFPFIPCFEGMRAGR